MHLITSLAQNKIEKNNGRYEKYAIILGVQKPVIIALW